tara:strand:+ start:5274 stop:5507 length:234 start_codon:yes stop_codon:yes gene_type:complete
LGQHVRLTSLTHGLGDTMSDLDSEQNRRIRDVEARINEVENQMAAILAKLEQATTLLKIVGIGLGAMVGIDIQGMVV